MHLSANKFIGTRYWNYLGYAWQLFKKSEIAAYLTDHPDDGFASGTHLANKITLLSKNAPDLLYLSLTYALFQDENHWNYSLKL